MRIFVLMKAITRRLRVLRAAKPISQRDLAIKAKLPHGRYMEIERGYRSPEQAEIERIAKALNVAPTEIVSSPADLLREVQS